MTLTATQEHSVALTDASKARQELDALHTRVEAGDRKVKPADLSAAEAAVALAERRAAGAAGRAAEEQAAEAAAARTRAIEGAKVAYIETAEELAGAVSESLAALERLVRAAAHHKAATAANLVGLTTRDLADAGVRVSVPEPGEVLYGVQVAAVVNARLPDLHIQNLGLQYSDVAIEPIKPFLPTEVPV